MKNDISEKKLLMINAEECDRCGTCIAVCPTNALHLACGPVEVDAARCCRCAVCVHICPVGALQLLDESSKKDEDTTHG